MLLGVRIEPGLHFGFPPLRSVFWHACFIYMNYIRFFFSILMICHIIMHHLKTMKTKTILVELFLASWDYWQLWLQSIVVRTHCRCDMWKDYMMILVLFRCNIILTENKFHSSLSKCINHFLFPASNFISGSIPTELALATSLGFLRIGKFRSKRHINERPWNWKTHPSDQCFPNLP